MRRMRLLSDRLVFCAVGVVWVLAGCGSAGAACDWPEVDRSGWVLLEETGFTLRVPRTYQYVYQRGGESEVRFWRAGERTLKSDWGDRNAVAGGLRERREGDSDWQACDIAIGGYRAQVVTYKTPKEYFVVEAFWAELPSVSWRGGGIRPALWLVATGPDRDSRREALAIIRTAAFAGRPGGTM